MFDKLLTLKSLVVPDPPQPAHAELEHSHWDADSHTWLTHPQPSAQEEAA
jgi:hypothetical protein